MSAALKRAEAIEGAIRRTVAASISRDLRALTVQHLDRISVEDARAIDVALAALERLAIDG